MRIEYSTTDPESFLEAFAGRVAMPKYDEKKPLHIAECNRDFVWNESMQRDLIESILIGHPIPTFTVCNNKLVDGGNRATTMHRFRNDELSIEFSGFSGTFSEMKIYRQDLIAMWYRCKLNRMIVTDATQDEMSKIYENLNKGVNLTHGQLLKNRSHYPLVSIALAMLSRGSATFRYLQLLHNVWKSKFKASKPLSELSFAFQFLIAALFGSSHYHTNFFNHLTYIMGKSSADIDGNMKNLRAILSTISNADPNNLVERKKKADCFKRFIGAMIHDFHAKAITSEQYDAKWTRFFRDAYNVLTKDQLKGLVDVGTKRAHFSSRMQGVSENVDKYLQGLPIPQTDAHANDDSSDDEE